MSTSGRVFASPREAVILDDGTRVEGALVEYVDGDHVTLALDSGERRRLEWIHIRSVGDASPAAATGAVTLQDGTVLRGEVLETAAGDHVSIRLVGGELRRVPWDQVAGVATGTGNATTANETSLLLDRMRSRFAGSDGNEILTDWPEPDRTPSNIPAMRLSFGVESQVNGPLGHFAVAAEVARQWGLFGVGLHAAYAPDGQIGPTLAEMLSIDWSYGSSVQQGLGIGLAEGFRSATAIATVADRLNYVDADVSHLTVFVSRRFLLRAQMGLAIPIGVTCTSPIASSDSCGIGTVGLYGMATLMSNFGGDE